MLELFDRLLTEMKIVESRNKLVGISGEDKRAAVVDAMMKYLRANDANDVIIALMPFLIDLIIEFANETIDLRDLKRGVKKLDNCCLLL